MSDPIALSLGRPTCWLVCAKALGQLELTLTAAQAALIYQDQLVLVHTSAGKGSDRDHRRLEALCRDAGVQPIDQRLLEKDIWRGVAQVRKVEQIEKGRYRLGLQGLHLFTASPWWGTPAAGTQLWLPDADLVESLMSEWDRDARSAA